MKVNLGNISYDVKMTTKLDKDLCDDEQNRGICRYEELRILLDKDLPTELKIQTLYHELCHAIMEETSFNSMAIEKFGDNGYEIFIDSLGKVLYTFIHNNDLKKLENYVKDSDNRVELFEHENHK